MDLPPNPPSDARLREALRSTLHRRTIAQGTITLPAVPAMIDEYMRVCLETFGAIGVVFDEAQRIGLRDVLNEQLDIAFAASPRSEIVITYEAPVGMTVNYFVKPQFASVEQTYDKWTATREPPYFGSEPDARVWALACEHSEPSACSVLDIGAGTGRNSLALARRGHPVDALEVSGNFAESLREQARRESVGIRVIQRDLFDAADYLPGDYQLVVVSEVVSDFRSPTDLRRLFELAASCTTPGGHLVLNAFIAHEDYQPDDAARQLGQQTYTAVLTRTEVQEAVHGLPFTLIDDVDTYDYEHEHLTPEAWPPTGWYEGWVTGHDLFSLGRGECPISMRWLAFRRDAERES